MRPPNTDDDVGEIEGFVFCRQDACDVAQLAFRRRFFRPFAFGYDDVLGASHPELSPIDLDGLATVEFETAVRSGLLNDEIGLQPVVMSMTLNWRCPWSAEVEVAAFAFAGR